VGGTVGAAGQVLVVSPVVPVVVLLLEGVVVRWLVKVIPGQAVEAWAPIRLTKRLVVVRAAGVEVELVAGDGPVEILPTEATEDPALPSIPAIYRFIIPRPCFVVGAPAALPLHELPVDKWSVVPAALVEEVICTVPVLPIPVAVAEEVGCVDQDPVVAVLSYSLFKSMNIHDYLIYIYFIR